MGGGEIVTFLGMCTCGPDHLGFLVKVNGRAGMKFYHIEVYV